jgi:hypothetical protein
MTVTRQSLIGTAARLTLTVAGVGTLVDEVYVVQISFTHLVDSCEWHLNSPFRVEGGYAQQSVVSFVRTVGVNITRPYVCRGRRAPCFQGADMVDVFADQRGLAIHLDGQPACLDTL